MKWRDHTRIARATAAILNLPEGQLVKGSVDPDAFRATQVVVGRRGRIYQTYERHHGNIGAITRELKTARRLIHKRSRKENSTNYQTGVYYLGRALHYIHDSCTGKGFLHLFHDSLEERIVSVELPKDAFRLGSSNAQLHPARLRKTLSHISQSNDPKKILWNAAYYGTLALKSVIEQGDVASARVEAESLVTKFEKSMFTVAILVLFLFVVGLSTRNYVYFFASLLGLTLFAFPYSYKSRREELVDWLGLPRHHESDARKSGDREGKREFKDRKDLKKFLSKYK